MLNRLSLDAIVAITNELEGRDIARLWICGDALLNHRLGRGGGVKKFSQTFDSLFPGTWPSIVRYFASLEEFTVLHAWREVPEGEWKPRYSDLSKTVVRIRLAHPDDIISFHEALLAGGTPNLLELTNVSSTSSRNLPEEDFQSLMAHLSHLQVLVFDRMVAIRLPPSVWPKSLRKLCVHLLDEAPIVLPEAMEELDWKIDESTPSPFSIQWPPSLHTIAMSCNNAITLEEARRLPRGLTDLRLPFSKFDNSPEFWKALPPNLTKLRLSAFVELKPVIERLPRTIKSCYNLPAPTLENVKLYPPSLTAIEWSGTTHDPKMYELLPTGLRRIVFAERARTREEDNPWTRLPDTLEEVQCLDGRYLDHYDLSSCLSNLKLSGTDLMDKRLDRLASSKLLFLILYECKFDSQALIGCLPQGLRTLSVNRCDNFAMDGELCKILPKTLLTLEAYPVALAEPQALVYLPIELEKLHFSTSSLEVGFLGDGACLLPELKHLIIQVDDPIPGLAPYLLATLPRKLKTFNLIYPKTTPLDITDASLESLPPGLVILSIISAPALVSGRWLARRPRCLYRVRLGNVNVETPSERL